MSKNTYPYIDIGNRIKEFAEEKHGGLSNLSKIIKVSLQGLSQYVSGRNAPGKKLLIKLLETGCDINWLLTGKKMQYTKEGFNSFVYENVKLYAGLDELEKLKRENEQLKLKIERLIKEREKEHEKILKLLQQNK
jgi:transcriptional regulator with XRE-family HTH domain